MRMSAQSVVVEPTTDLSEGASDYSTGLLCQPSSGLRHLNQADHALVERPGSEDQTNLHEWQGGTADVGEAELQDTTADAGDTKWQENTADAGEAEWQKFNLLSLGHPAYLS